MVYTRLLVPLDGSQLAEAALPYAKVLARGLRARIELLRVVEPPSSEAVDSAHGIYPHRPADSVMSNARDYLEGIARNLREGGRPRAGRRPSGFWQSWVEDGVEVQSSAEPKRVRRGCEVIARGAKQSRSGRLHLRRLQAGSSQRLRKSLLTQALSNLLFDGLGSGIWDGGSNPRARGLADLPAKELDSPRRGNILEPVPVTAQPARVYLVPRDFK